MKEVLPVIFRAEKRGDHKGEITAVFPTLPGTNDPGTFTTYAHIGQHSAGTLAWYRETRPATTDERAALLKELQRVYSDQTLQIVARFTRAHDERRAWYLSAATLAKPAQACQWFARCGRPATCTTPHPVLGDVPTCQRCHDFATT